MWRRTRSDGDKPFLPGKQVRNPPPCRFPLAPLCVNPGADHSRARPGTNRKGQTDEIHPVLAEGSPRDFGPA